MARFEDYRLDPGLEFLFFELDFSAISAKAGSILLNLRVALREARKSLFLSIILRNFPPASGEFKSLYSVYIV